MFGSRRRFLQSSALAATLGLPVWPSRAAEPGTARADADLVLLNGTVYTVDEEQGNDHAGQARRLRGPPRLIAG